MKLKTLQLRRSTTNDELLNTINIEGEPWYATDKKTIYINDGVTTGGIALARVDQTQASIIDVITLTHNNHVDSLSRINHLSLTINDFVDRTNAAIIDAITIAHNTHAESLAMIKELYDNINDAIAGKPNIVMDMSKYATKEYVQDALKDLDVTIDLSAYTTREYVDGLINSLATKEYIDEQLNGLATRKYVEDLINNLTLAESNDDVITSQQLYMVFDDGESATTVSLGSDQHGVFMLVDPDAVASDAEPTRIYMTFDETEASTSVMGYDDNGVFIYVHSGRGNTQPSPVTVDLSNYATKAYVQDIVNHLSFDTSLGYDDNGVFMLSGDDEASAPYRVCLLWRDSTEATVTVDLSNYATKEYVQQTVAEHSNQTPTLGDVVHVGSSKPEKLVQLWFQTE